MTRNQAFRAFRKAVDQAGSQVAVARELGCTKSAVSHIYKRRKGAGLNLAIKIERCYGIPHTAWAVEQAA